jgi:phage gp29-like protein
MRRGLESLENATVAVGPFGSTVTLLDPQGNGEAFRAGFDEFRREIVFAILQQVRSTLEAQNSSKADSETAQDILGLVVRVAKKALAAAVRRDLLKPLVAMNYGDDVADRLTPQFSLGMVEMQDFSRNARAVATLATAGVARVDDEDERRGWLTWLGAGQLVRRFRRKPPAPAPAPQPPRPQPGQRAA